MMLSPLQIEKIIEYAIQAPSGHNTQPWKFVIKENEIQIHPDFDRALPIVDSDNHALYISLGCAAENSIIAAKNFRINSTLKLLKDENAVDFINIKLTLDSKIEKDDLFDFIEKRQVTRNAYNSKQIPTEDLNKIMSCFNFHGIEAKLFTAKKDIKRLEPFIIEGSNIQFQNKAFVNELVSWLRFSKNEVKKKGDGIWHASMAMPSTGRFLGNIIMKKFISAKSEAKRWKKSIKASAGFVLFVAEQNDILHLVNLGRAFQRFGLTATKLGISHAHANMPCEELEVREKMTKALGLENRHPLLLVRFGYSEKLPYSYRRPVDEVIEII